MSPQKQTTRGSLPCYYKEFDAQKFDSNFEKSISSGLSGFLVLIGILIVLEMKFYFIWLIFFWPKNSPNQNIY
jgi:hypothetical protein